MSELAWAAGFFDGEGSTNVGRYRSGRNSLLRVEVAQVDRRALDRFVSAVGGGTVRGPSFRSSRPRSAGIYHLTYFGPKAVAVISQLWIWLGPAKREQALRVSEELSRAGRPAAAAV